MIKNFIYLDEYKMYSLSSQIFEGITEYLINTQNETTEEKESQKGPVGSGRVLADILKSETGTTEKRYLHDYSYVLFEKFLIEQKKVLDIGEEQNKKVIELIPKYSFIKIRGKATLHDILAINETLKNFNEIRQALDYVANYEEIEKAKRELEKMKSETRDRNKKAVIKQKIKSLTKNTEGEIDKKFLDDMTMLLSYGFQDQFEIQINCYDFIFSSNLKREALREKEDILIRKYSRKTEKDFVVFGTVTQYSSNMNSNSEDKSSEDKSSEDKSSEDKTPKDIAMKEGLMALVSELTNVEKTFTGRLPNEIIIDPIAVYTEL